MRFIRLDPLGGFRARRAHPRAATRLPHRQAWLRISVVRCGLPCDPPLGGHAHAMQGGYHALAKDERCFCAAKGWSRPCLRWVSWPCENFSGRATRQTQPSRDVSQSRDRQLRARSGLMYCKKQTRTLFHHSCRADGNRQTFRPTAEYSGSCGRSFSDRTST